MKQIISTLFSLSKTHNYMWNILIYCFSLLVFFTNITNLFGETNLFVNDKGTVSKNNDTSSVKKNDSAETITSKQSTWESKLFVKEGKFYVRKEVDGFKLPDFSYAGYHSGEKAIPSIAVKNTISPQSGDNTAYIKSSLNASKGGALLLNPGVYNINSEIIIPPNTVLRGSGTDKTFIVMNAIKTTRMSAIVGNKSRLSSVNNWRTPEGLKIDIVGDIPKGTTQIAVKSVEKLVIGDFIVIKNEVTDDFRKEYNGVTSIGSSTIWPTDLSSIKYLRRITGITGQNITIDQPVLYELKSRDNACIIKISSMGEEIGLEDLSIGFTTPTDSEKYHALNVDGSASDYHAADAIFFGNVENGWIRNVKTFSPSNSDYHIHSRGIVLQNSRKITVENCDIGYPVNIGNGGNGYGYVISMSNDCLIKDSVARSTRHNFLFHFASAGNVISNCKSFYSLFPNDFHHSLANSNLIENMEVIVEPKNSYNQAFVTKNRGGGSTGAGFTGINNVFWRIGISPNNTGGIVSEQANVITGEGGFIIGSTYVEGETKTARTEWREGIGQRDTLFPESLYQAQLEYRLNFK